MPPKKTVVARVRQSGWLVIACALIANGGGHLEIKVSLTSGPAHTAPEVAAPATPRPATDAPVCTNPIHPDARHHQPACSRCGCSPRNRGPALSCYCGALQ